MCVVCGCSSGHSASPGVGAHRHEGEAHSPSHPGASPGTASAAPAALDFGAGAARVSVPGMSAARTVKLEADILGANNRIAARNRAHFESHRVTALNLVSSPGSGKTTLLCATIAALRRQAPALPVSVIEGDQQTSFDAERIRATGAPAIQVNTGKGCHLDAEMVEQAFGQLHSHDHDHDHGHGHAHGHSPRHDHAAPSLLFIENVGNLVCPALWDLGEDAKVAILSVTEGEDKPLKYPDMFAAASLMVLNKIDLLPHLHFDVERCIAMARRVNPAIEVIQLSATTGEGMEAWLRWIDQRLGHPGHAIPVARSPAGDAELHRRIAELEAELADARRAAATPHGRT